MNKHSTIVPFRQREVIDDPLTEILRAGARQLLAQAIESEAAHFLTLMQDHKLADGRDRLVRHGHGPSRPIQTGIGPLEVERVKIRDRGAAGAELAMSIRCSLRPRIGIGRRSSLPSRIPPNPTASSNS